MLCKSYYGEPIDPAARAHPSINTPSPSLQPPQAIAALKAMFGHVPQATLEAVLRAQKWNMERTVEALLELNGAEPPPSSQQPPPLPQPTMPGPSSSSSAGQQPRRRGKPVALPDDFLRVPGRQQHQHARSLSGEEQLRADEALAQQLQQQETAVAGVDARYQQHRRERAASLQHPPQAQAHARRPRMQSAPGYPPSAGAGGRAPSPGVEESLEKLGKAIGQAGANVKKRVGDLYARFLNAKGGRHQRMEDDEVRGRTSA